MLPPIALPDNRVAGLCAHLGNIDDFATVDIHQWVIRFQRFVILRLALLTLKNILYKLGSQYEKE